jgi:excinuclease ABC subunit C
MVAPIEFTKRVRGVSGGPGGHVSAALRAEAQIEAASARVRARIRPATLADPRPAAELRAHVRASAENRPGIYRMLGPGDEMLYVGKSIRVRTRLLSYFRADHEEKAAEIIRNTHRIEWEYVPSEFAAVLHEMRAIQQWRPPYNVEHKRDRAFCFVKITREAAPRLLAVAEVASDGAQYFGPFRGRENVRATLREVIDLLELRDCKSGIQLNFADQLDLFGADHTPQCLRADLHRCLAPCAGRCTKSEYQEHVELAQRFLEGDADMPLTILRRRMHTAVERLQYEYAAELRDRMFRLDEARHQLVALRGVIESLTFLYHPTSYGGNERVYIVRRGSIIAERPAPTNEAEQKALRDEAHTLLTKKMYATAAVQPTQVAEILLLARWFRLRPDELGRTWSPGGVPKRNRLPVL